MRKKTGLIIAAAVFAISLASVCQGNENLHTLRIFTPDHEKTFEGSVGGLLGALAEEGPQDKIRMTEEAFLVISRHYLTGFNIQQEAPASGAYIVSEGTVITMAYGLRETVDFTIHSVTETEVTFSTDKGDALVASGQPDENGIFTVKKGELLTVWNYNLADAEESYDFRIADVSIWTAVNPTWFTWDMNGDGNPEQVDLQFFDNGDEARSGFAMDVTDEENDWYTWSAWLDGLYEISTLRIISGEQDNFLIIDGFAGDYYSHDIPISMVVVFENDEIQVLY